MSVTVQVNDRDVVKMLSNLREVGSDGRQLAAHIGARVTQDHFAARGGEFYAKAARSTTGRVQGDDVVISIDHIGIGLRRFGSKDLPGGVVKPTGSRKYLAIPDDDNPQAKSNSPRRIPGLHFRRNSKGNKYGESGRLTDATGRVFFWLTKAAKHNPDPTVLPTDAAFAGAILPELEAKLERI